MSIRFQCQNPDCRKTVVAGDELAGKKARCPHCGAGQTVPQRAPQPAGPSAGERSDFEGPPGGRPPGAARGQPVDRSADRALLGESRTYTPQTRNTKRVLPIIVLVIIVGLVVVAIYSLLKQAGTTATKYTEPMITAKERAVAVGSMNNLAGIGKAIQTLGGQLPASLEALVSAGLVPADMLKSRSGKSFAYIPGQREDMPRENILVYEEEPGPDGKCMVLRLGGQVESLTPEQLRAQAQQTKAQLGAGRGGG